MSTQARMFTTPQKMFRLIFPAHLYVDKIGEDDDFRMGDLNPIITFED